MNNWVLPLISGIAGVIAATGVTTIVLSSWLRRLEQSAKDTARQLEDLKSHRIHRLETTVERMPETCATGLVVRAKLETLIQQNNEILLELKRLNRDQASQESKVAEIRNHLDALHRSFSEHRGHGHGKT